MENLSTHINGLIRVLASTVILRAKVRCFIWSLGVSPKSMLKSLLDGDHHLLDHMSDELVEAINERGGKIPCHYSQLLKLSSIKEEDPSLTEPKSVMNQLLNDHQQVILDLDLLIVLLRQDNEQPVERFLQKLLEKVNSGMLNLRQAISILNIQ